MRFSLLAYRYEGERRTPLHQICGHYDHRGLLRRTHRVLTEGGMIPLFARYEFGWHDRVFAFARFTQVCDVVVLLFRVCILVRKRGAALVLPTFLMYQVLLFY